MAVWILENVKLSSYNRGGRLSTGGNLARLQGKTWAHFARHIPATAIKKHPTKACKVCTSCGKESEATWESDVRCHCLFLIVLKASTHH
jgi:hypothetical protein